MHRPTRHGARRLLAGAVLTVTALTPAAAQAQTGTQGPVTRLPGGTNVQVAVAYSEVTFADGSAPIVLLARDDDFADTLTSSSAQGVLNAPLLLTDTDVLSPETAAELARLDPEEVRIMGGTAAVSEAVATAVEAQGATVTRYAGATRVETAIEVARVLFPQATSAVVARAFANEDGDPTQAFADPVAAGAYSAASNTPVLLTMSDDLPDAISTYIAGSTIESAMIAGGTGAVTDAVRAELAGIDVSDLNLAEEGAPAPSFGVTRISGPTRGGTATALAADLGYPSAAGAGRVILLEGAAADAWAAGLTVGAQAGNGAAVVLAYGPSLYGETSAFLDPGSGRTPLLCGPRVDQAACDAAATLLGAGA